MPFKNMNPLDYAIRLKVVVYKIAASYVNAEGSNRFTKLIVTRLCI